LASFRLADFQLTYDKIWKIDHTVINGRRLFFNGRGASLLGYWILWLALSVGTTGGFLLAVPVLLERWKVRNIS